MKKTVRILALVMSVLMIAGCFVACKKDEGPADDSNSTVDNNSVSTNSGDYVSKLPDNDYGAEDYLVLGQSDSANAAWKNFEISRDEMPSDIVGKAVWERNDAIKQKYNLVICEELVSESHAKIQTYYASNEDKYDMVMTQLRMVFAHSESGFLVDLTEVPNVDLDHPAWNDFTVEQFTLGGALYIASSDFNLQNKAQLSCLFYNRDMARDAGDGYLEDLVASNQWTLDKYNEIIRQYSADTDGNGAKGNQGDTFGTCGDQWNFLNFAVGAGYRASVVNNGDIQMAGAGDNILNILEGVGKFLFDSQNSFVTESVKPLDWMRSMDMFKDGRALCFAGEVADYDEGLNEVSFELGVLPFPKYDSVQESYYTQVNPVYSSLCSIPKTVVDTDLAGFGFEVLAEYSSDTTYEAYIETKCKLQDSFDQKMSDMYETIFENPVYDIVIIGGFGKLKRAMMTEVPTSKQASRYATLYSARADAAQEEIDSLKTNLGLG